MYTSASEACEQGWKNLKKSAYNGKLSDSQAIFHQGLCDIYLDSDIVASLPVQNSNGKNDFPLHTLTRPDGTLTTFFEKQGEWVTTTHAPLRLKQKGEQWQVTSVNDSTETYNKKVSSFAWPIHKDKPPA